MNRLRRHLTVVLLSVLASAIAFGQNTTPAPSNATRSVPLTVQWFFFLSTVDYTDRTSTKLQLQGKDGTSMRNLHQKPLGFTDEQFQPIRLTAERLMAQFGALNAQIHAAFVMYRQTGSSTYSTQRAALLQQREALMRNEVTNLRAALGPELSAAVDAYLAKSVASNATVSHPPEVTP